MAKESPTEPQQKLLNPEAAVFIPAPVCPEDLFGQLVEEAGQKVEEYRRLMEMQAQALTRGNTRGRPQNRRRRAPRSRGPEQVPLDAVANPDANGAAPHGECEKQPGHAKSTSLIGLALDQTLTANTVASFVQQHTASGLFGTATSSSGKAFVQPNNEEEDWRSQHTRTLFERDPAMISRKETRVGVNMEGRGSYNETKKLAEREASNEQRIVAPTHIATTVTSLPTGPTLLHQHRHSSASSVSHQSQTRTPSGLHHSRRLSRTKRVDQGPMPSMADIYPDDAHWPPPAVAHERGQSYMSYSAQHVQQTQFDADGASKWTPRQLAQQSRFNVDNTFKWPQFNVEKMSKWPTGQPAQQPQFNVGNALKETPPAQPVKPLEGLGVSSDAASERPPSAQPSQQSQTNVDTAPTWPRVKAYDPYKRRPLPQYEKPLEGLGPSALNPDTAPKPLPYIYDNVFARSKPPVDRKNHPVQPVQQPQVSADDVAKRPPFEPVMRFEVTVDNIFKRPKPPVPQPQLIADNVHKRTPPTEPKKSLEASVAEAAKFWSSRSEPDQRLQALIDHTNAPTPASRVNKPGLSLTATDISRSDAVVHTVLSEIPKPSCTWRDLAPVERSLADDKITGKKWGVQMGGIGDGRLWMVSKDQHGNEPPSLWPKDFEPRKTEFMKSDPKNNEPKKPGL